MRSQEQHLWGVPLTKAHEIATQFNENTLGMQTAPGDPTIPFSLPGYPHFFEGRTLEIDNAKHIDEGDTTDIRFSGPFSVVPSEGNELFEHLRESLVSFPPSQQHDIASQGLYSKATFLKGYRLLPYPLGLQEHESVFSEVSIPPECYTTQLRPPFDAVLGPSRSATSVQYSSSGSVEVYDSVNLDFGDNRNVLDKRHQVKQQQSMGSPSQSLPLFKRSAESHPFPQTGDLMMRFDNRDYNMTASGRTIDLATSGAPPSGLAGASSSASTLFTQKKRTSPIKYDPKDMLLWRKPVPSGRGKNCTSNIQQMDPLGGKSATSNAVPGMSWRTNACNINSSIRLDQQDLACCFRGEPPLPPQQQVHPSNNITSKFPNKPVDNLGNSRIGAYTGDVFRSSKPPEHGPAVFGGSLAGSGLKKSQVGFPIRNNNNNLSGSGMGHPPSGYGCSIEESSLYIMGLDSKSGEQQQSYHGNGDQLDGSHLTTMLGSSSSYDGSSSSSLLEKVDWWDNHLNSTSNIKPSCISMNPTATDENGIFDHPSSASSRILASTVNNRWDTIPTSIRKEEQVPTRNLQQGGAVIARHSPQLQQLFESGSRLIDFTEQPNFPPVGGPVLELTNLISAPPCAELPTHEKPQSKHFLEYDDELPPALPKSAPPSPEANNNSNTTQWTYRDPTGVVQGPFSTTQMLNWWHQNYLPNDLPIRSLDSTSDFIPLNELFKDSETPFISKKLTIVDRVEDNLSQTTTTTTNTLLTGGMGSKTSPIPPNTTTSLSSTADDKSTSATTAELLSSWSEESSTIIQELKQQQRKKAPTSPTTVTNATSRMSANQSPEVQDPIAVSGLLENENWAPADCGEEAVPASNKEKPEKPQKQNSTTPRGHVVFAQEIPQPQEPKKAAQGAKKNWKESVAKGTVVKHTPPTVVPHSKPATVKIVQPSKPPATWGAVVANTEGPAQVASLAEIIKNEMASSVDPQLSTQPQKPAVQPINTKPIKAKSFRQAAVKQSLGELLEAQKVNEANSRPKNASVWTKLNLQVHNIVPIQSNDPPLASQGKGPVKTKRLDPPKNSASRPWSSVTHSSTPGITKWDSSTPKPRPNELPSPRTSTSSLNVQSGDGFFWSEDQPTSSRTYERSPPKNSNTPITNSGGVPSMGQEEQDLILLCNEYGIVFDPEFFLYLRTSESVSDLEMLLRDNLAEYPVSGNLSEFAHSFFALSKSPFETATKLTRKRKCSGVAPKPGK